MRTNCCFGKVVGAKRCFQVPVTDIDVCLETLKMTCILFGMHFLSTSIEILPEILYLSMKERIGSQRRKKHIKIRYNDQRGSLLSYETQYGCTRIDNGPMLKAST